MPNAEKGSEVETQSRLGLQVLPLASEFMREQLSARAGRRQRAYAAPISAGLLAARAFGALRHLTRRMCSSAVSAANVASYVTGQETEQRRGA